MSDFRSERPMPAVFIGHGSPMNTLEINRYTTGWADFAANMARPGAVVCVSAHWYIGQSAVTAMANPRTIHDFTGFPDELNHYQYPAPGAPELAQRIVELLEPVTPVTMDHARWGLDHGTWSVLAHLYPDADIPVIQLSIDATKSPAEHLDLGRRLDGLRSDGILIVGSGNVVHNLGAMSGALVDSGFDWAVEFDSTANTLMAEDPEQIVGLVDHPAYRLAAPTPEHLIPLYYVAGIAERSGSGTEIFNLGYSFGSLSMTCHIAN